MVDSPRNWWETPRLDPALLATFTADCKRKGDSDLPAPVRDYLHTQEQCQHHEMSAMPRPKTTPPSP